MAPANPMAQISKVNRGSCARVVLSIAFLLLASCEFGDGKVDRTLLSYMDLMYGFEFTSPLSEDALALPERGGFSTHKFKGRLELHGEGSSGNWTILRGAPEDQWPDDVAFLPEFDFEFVQSRGHLIPVRRGQIITDNPHWNYILGPGRVWREDGDRGFSRASFPFTLILKDTNISLNGTMTFLFDRFSVSKVWYQITQETSAAISLEFWGLLDASYHHGDVKRVGQIRKAYDDELENRFPSKPYDALPEDHPGANPAVFKTTTSLTWSGFVIDGVSYVSDCPTRYGAYPYCESMRAASDSTAKSGFVAVALMRLEQKYGPGVPELLIEDYVPEAADSVGDWNGVTFDHALDMATGNYGSARFFEDGTDPSSAWNSTYERTYSNLIEAAFSWPNKSAPGEQWVYHTSDTFIVTEAMQNFLQSKEGPDADIYEFVVEEVYKPLKMGPGVFTTLRTSDDNWQGLPIGGAGMWWTQDDLAKLTNFLNADGGMIDGVQVLHPGVLAAALQRDPEDRGLSTVGPDDLYNTSFWAERYRSYSGWDCDFWVPRMSGYSGIVVALMPNETNFFYASDGQDFRIDTPVRGSNKIIPHCPESE